MRRLMALALLICLLSGCSQRQQVENQAYVLVMGVDRTPDGIRITAQMPKVSQNDQADNGAAGGSYMKLSVSGTSYADVLQRLSWAVPRTLNLSQLKMLVLSEEIARDPMCGDLLEEIAQTKRLFAAAQVVVCAGDASGFVIALEAVMGSRLSTDITSMFDHYIESGEIPECRLADCYYLTKSIYSDPMLIYANYDDASTAFSETLEEAEKRTRTDVKNHYLGAALFSNGSMRGLWGRDETILANLIRGSTRTFKYEYEGRNLDIAPSRPPTVRIDTDAEPVRVSVSLHLTVNSQEASIDPDALSRDLRMKLYDLLTDAQRMDIEPFGFAECAARNFTTIDEFIEYGWKRRFAGANFDINVNLLRADA